MVAGLGSGTAPVAWAESAAKALGGLRGCDPIPPTESDLRALRRFGLDMSGPAGWAKSLVEKLNGSWKIDHPRILDEKRKIMEGIYTAVGHDKVFEDKVPFAPRPQSPPSLADAPPPSTLSPV